MKLFSSSDRRSAPGDSASNTFVLTHLLPTCLRAASRCGINVIDFVRRAGVSPLTLLPGHGDLPVPELFRLLNLGTLAGWLAKPGGHIPVLFAECFQFDYLSDATGYLTSSANLKEAAQLFNWVSPLICPPAKIEVLSNQSWSTAVLTLDEATVDPAITWTVAETVLCTWFRLCQDLTHQQIKPARVEFKHAPHAMRDACDRFFGLTCEFNAPRDAITLTRHDVEVELPSSLPILNRFSKERLLRQLDIKEAEVDWSKHNAALGVEHGEMPPITKRLMEIYQADPRMLSRSVGDMAAAMQITVRTLQRRLQEAGTSFSNVQAKARLLLAKDKLLEPQVQIDSIAAMLGFPDRRTFSTFYKRMTGLTPREWRKLHGMGG